MLKPFCFCVPGSLPHQCPGPLLDLVPHYLPHPTLSAGICGGGPLFCAAHGFLAPLNPEVNVLPALFAFLLSCSLLSANDYSGSLTCCPCPKSVKVLFRARVMSNMPWPCDSWLYLTPVAVLVLLVWKAHCVPCPNRDLSRKVSFSSLPQEDSVYSVHLLG